MVVHTVPSAIGGYPIEVQISTSDMDLADGVIFKNPLKETEGFEPASIGSFCNAEIHGDPQYLQVRELD